MTAPGDRPDDGPVRPGGSPEGGRPERQPEPGDEGALGGRGSPRPEPETATGDSTGFGWKVVVDRDLCQGHGVCEAEAPEVFEVPKHEVVVLIETPPDSERTAVEAAVKYCPTHALSVQEDRTT